MYKENTLLKIPDSIYFDIDRVSSSRLRLYEENPEQYNLKYVIKCVPDDSGTDALVIGAAAHCRTLEGEEEYQSRYAVMPSFGRSVADVDLRAKFETENFGKIIITEKQDKAAKYIAKAARNHKLFQELIEKANPLVEQTVLFQFCGVECKAKIDMLGWVNDKPVIIDLKTTQSASPPAFLDSIDKYGYIRQMGFYLKAVACVMLELGANLNMTEDIEVYLFAVDKGFPSRGSLYKFTPRTLEKSIKSNTVSLQRIKDAYAENKWCTPWTTRLHQL